MRVLESIYCVKKPPILSVSCLSILRSGTAILNQLDWSVLPGEHWVILGPNGSGKTSLLSALTGYLAPTRGTIRVFNQQFGRTDWRELRKRIGLVSSAIRQQMEDGEPALRTVVSGKTATIDVWGALSKEDASKASDLLALVDCSHLAERPWFFLSQGERQRVLIARALMADPKLLILDEPCAGLDPVGREHFLRFLSSVATHRSAPALVLVTHHVEEIIPAFTHALLLRSGSAIAAGPVATTLTSKALSDMFESPVRIRKNRSGRYALTVSEEDEGWVAQ